MYDLLSPGRFFVGCNYWATHAGTAMWSDWRPRVVEADFRRLARANICVLRVFPLWSDFQPIHLLRGGGGAPREYRFGELPLPDDELGQAGVSAEAMAHFAEFAALAEKHGMQLIVGLVTGWMSGRLFMPPALEGLNPIMDPVSIQWQVRFVKTFVKRFRGARAIVAWDLGNECNCMGPVASSAAAWTWSASIANAVKAGDTTRPVVSGMHSLSPDGNWRIQDQAEITDILTTHPYPYFTPHCDQDPLNTIRTELHAVAETLFYRGIGGKPCFVEETGTLGPMFANDEVGAAFIRANLFTLWAHGCHGLLWWCAAEQSQLAHAPYDWNAVERELGLFRSNGSPKPVAQVMRRFAEFTGKIPGGALPARLVDGVCLLTRGQDAWGAAYGAFTLARQAGLDIEFRHVSQPIPDAKFYLLPALCGDAAISRRRMTELLAQVRAGAALYLSVDTALLSPFEEFAGVRVISRSKRATADTVLVGGKHRLTLQGTYKLALENVRAEVLATDQDGQPAFTCAAYGKGNVFFLNYPVETCLLKKPGAFHEPGAEPYWAIYRELRRHLPRRKVVDVDDRCVGVTEHIVDARKRIVVAVNYRPEDGTAEFTLRAGWRLAKSLYGGRGLARHATGKTRLRLPANDAAVFVIGK